VRMNANANPFLQTTPMLRRAVSSFWMPPSFSSCLLQFTPTSASASFATSKLFLCLARRQGLTILRTANSHRSGGLGSVLLVPSWLALGDPKSMVSLLCLLLVPQLSSIFGMFLITPKKDTLWWVFISKKTRQLLIVVQPYFWKHFRARALGLILLPFIVYLSFFWVHFTVLNQSGTGDSFMSPAFQETLAGNEMLLKSKGAFFKHPVDYIADLSQRFTISMLSPSRTRKPRFSSIPMTSATP